MTKVHWSPRFERTARVALIAIGLGLVLFNFLRIIIGPIGDFHNHWQLGHELLAGHSLYLAPDGRPFRYPNPYPPFWTMAHAPLTIVSPHVAQAVLFLPLYLGSLVLLFWILHRLTQTHLSLDPDQEFWVTALTLVVAVQFVARDMAECGVNIALIALAWLAVYFWTRQHDWWAGLSLGVAIALKMTAALFVPYLVWKRQWKLAGAATLFALLFTVAPVLVRGPARFGTDLREWITVVRGIQSEDPSAHVIGQESAGNFGLRPALLRLIADHRSEDAPDVSSLPGRTAVLLVYAVELALLLSFGWITRGPASDRASIIVLYECAGVSLLMLLLSPITWGHHCVGTVPALYLIFRTAFRYRELPGWMWALLGYVWVSLLFNRAIIGKQFSAVLSSYSVVTWEIVALLALTVGCRGLAVRKAVH